MDPSEIPRPQSARVALYQQQFGTFDSGKNAYWSLRKGRPVTLAEGARFDSSMRAGRLAPVARRVISRTVRRVDMVPSMGPPPMRNGFKAFSGRMDQTAFRGGRMGWWKNTQTGQMKSGRQLTPPSRMAGWRWSLRQPAGAIYTTMPVAPPQEKFLHMPTEAKRIAALPATPRPGPARPPAEPLWDAIKRQIQEKRAGPAITMQPDFARPAPGPVAVAGFPMKKLALPLALVAGAFVVSKLV